MERSTRFASVAAVPQAYMLPANLHPPYKMLVVAADPCTPVLQMQAAGLRHHSLTNAAKQVTAQV